MDGNIMAYSMTPEQIKLSRFVDLRCERDRLLAETDWWAGSDLTMSDARKNYRQALRDMPANTSDPDPASLVWPEKPE